MRRSVAWEGDGDGLATDGARLGPHGLLLAALPDTPGEAASEVRERAKCGSTAILFSECAPVLWSTC